MLYQVSVSGGAEFAKRAILQIKYRYDIIKKNAVLILYKKDGAEKWDRSQHI